MKAKMAYIIITANIGYMSTKSKGGINYGL